MAHERTIAILGAHTAVAKSLVECIEERALPVALRRLTTTDHIEEDLDLFGPASLEDADLLVLAFGGPFARSLAAAPNRTRPMLDISGGLRDADHPQAHHIYPTLDAAAGLALQGRALAVVPVGLALPLVAVLRALAPFGLVRATVATQESAACLDRAGMDGLSEQVRALFAMRDADPALFGGTLAFNVLPNRIVAGELALSPFDAEDQLEREIRRGLSGSAAAEIEIAVSRLLVPTFSAEAAAIHVQMVQDTTLAAVHDALRAARGIRLSPELITATDAVGRDDALVGDVRVRPGHVSLWLTADRLRHASATAGVLAIEQWLAAQGGLDEAG